MNVGEGSWRKEYARSPLPGPVASEEGSPCLWQAPACPWTGRPEPGQQCMPRALVLGPFPSPGGGGGGGSGGGCNGDGARGQGKVSWSQGAGKGESFGSGVGFEPHKDLPVKPQGPVPWPLPGLPTGHVSRSLGLSSSLDPGALPSALMELGGSEILCAKQASPHKDSPPPQPGARSQRSSG